jgi:hypothetical protein
VQIGDGVEVRVSGLEREPEPLIGGSRSWKIRDGDVRVIELRERVSVQQGIDPLKFRIGSKLSFALELHIKNLDENSLTQNQMKNLILVISVDNKGKDYINVVYKNWKMSLKEPW